MRCSMNKYKKVTDIEVLKTYYNLQSNHNAAGIWLDYIPVDVMENYLKTSKYQIRKAYKNLKEIGFMKIDKVPCYCEEYYNGLYDEVIPVLFTKLYIITQKGIEKVKEDKNNEK